MNQLKLKHFDNITWAVFNCNKHDQAKARKVVLARFGNEGWKKVLARKRSGIMEIFKYTPTPETKLYAQTVALSADSRCAKKRMQA